MTTKAITFLGYTAPDRPYRETTYVWEGHECTTPFMAEATAYDVAEVINLQAVREESRRRR